MNGPVEIKELLQQALVGKQVRFPDLPQQSARDEIHTVESIRFVGYKTDAFDDEDPGVSVHIFCAPKGSNSPDHQTAAICGLNDRIEFVETKTFEPCLKEKMEFAERHTE